MTAPIAPIAPISAISAISAHFDIAAKKAAMLLVLYETGELIPGQRLADLTGIGSVKSVHVQFCQFRHQCGSKHVEWIRYSGYRLTPVGRDHVRAALKAAARELLTSLEAA